MNKKQLVMSTIYNRSTQTKAQMREEAAEAMARFLKAGGVIQTSDKSPKVPEPKMRARTTKNFSGGSSGFATGYPRSSSAFK